MSLYKTDYYLWVLETVNQLQSRDFTSIDWEIPMGTLEQILDAKWLPNHDPNQ